MINGLRRWGPACLFFVLFLSLWELGVWIYAPPTWMLPAPSAILTEMIEAGSTIYPHVWATLRIALWGLIWGVVVGVLMASILHLLPWFRRAVYPLILLSQNIPMIALAPLLVVWFGFGDFPKLLVVILVCFFPVTVATLDGFAQTDRTLTIYMKMSGASRLKRFFRLEWPSALPSFFSGFKLSATYSVMGAVIAEWLGAEKGIGKMMTLASKSYETERVFVAILLVVGLSLLLFALISWFEKRMVRWKKEAEGENNETQT